MSRSWGEARGAVLISKIDTTLLIARPGWPTCHRRPSAGGAASTNVVRPEVVRYASRNEPARFGPGVGTHAWHATATAMAETKLERFSPDLVARAQPCSRPVTPVDRVAAVRPLASLRPTPALSCWPAKRSRDSSSWRVGYAVRRCRGARDLGSAVCRLADAWRGAGVNVHDIEVPADHEVEQAWFTLGFGRRTCLGFRRDLCWGNGARPVVRCHSGPARCRGGRGRFPGVGHHRRVVAPRGRVQGDSVRVRPSGRHRL